MYCRNAIAIFDGTKVTGYLKFHQCASDLPVSVNFNISKMKPNSEFAIHIHEFGDTSDGCTSLGSHLNLELTEHGSILIDLYENVPIGTNQSHTGDLINNIFIDKDGNFNYTYDDPRLSLFGEVSKTILGCSVVIHEKSDDYGLGGNEESKKTGNAGGRMACAIIGKSKNGECCKTV